MTTYIVAVSGGVDSMVLLDKISRQNDEHRYIVAHVDHGIRQDSHKDQQLVEKAAADYNLSFESTKLQLGSSASEDEARIRRYRWLEQVKSQYQATAIVTAHHQDDVIETMIINLRRGTGWRGLASLRSTESRLRPLLTMSKAEIVDYAIDRNIEWREDSTNDDMRIVRNRIRNSVMRRLEPSDRQALWEIYLSQSEIRQAIENEAQKLMEQASDGSGLSRYYLIMLGSQLGYELIRSWLGDSLTAPQQRRLYHFICTAKNGSRIELEGGRQLMVNQRQLVVYRPSI